MSLSPQPAPRPRVEGRGPAEDGLERGSPETGPHHPAVDRVGEDRQDLRPRLEELVDLGGPVREAHVLEAGPEDPAPEERVTDRVHRRRLVQRRADEEDASSFRRPVRHLRRSFRSPLEGALKRR